MKVKIYVYLLSYSMLLKEGLSQSKCGEEWGRREIKQFTMAIWEVETSGYEVLIGFFPVFWTISFLIPEGVFWFLVGLGFFFLHLVIWGIHEQNRASWGIYCGSLAAKKPMVNMAGLKIILTSYVSYYFFRTLTIFLINGKCQRFFDAIYFLVF